MCVEYDEHTKTLLILSPTIRSEFTDMYRNISEATQVSNSKSRDCSF